MRLFIFLLLLSINLISANSHEQQIKQVHQRIVYEVYRILILQWSEEKSGIADIDNYLGPVSHHIPSLLYPWDAIYTLTVGAVDEDYQRYSLWYLVEHNTFLGYWQSNWLHASSWIWLFSIGISKIFKIYLEWLPYQ